MSHLAMIVYFGFVLTSFAVLAVIGAGFFASPGRVINACDPGPSEMRL